MLRTRPFGELRRRILTDPEVAAHYLDVTSENSPEDYSTAVRHVHEARVNLPEEPRFFNFQASTEAESVPTPLGGGGQSITDRYNAFSILSATNFGSSGDLAYGSVGHS